MENVSNICDRISALPDEVLHQILSFMGEVHHAITTSVLSKRWRYQWTFNPNLSFPSYCDGSPAFRKPNRGFPTKPYGNCNMEIIDKTLTQYQANQLQKLRIQIYETKEEVSVYEWFKFAIERKVEELTVIAPIVASWDFLYYIPPRLFKTALRSLSLSHCSLYPFPVDVKCFESLESISISYFQHSNGAFQTLVSKCRNLQSLSFTIHTKNRFIEYSLTKFSLSLSKLQHLHIGFGSMYSLLEIDAPNLRTIRIEDDFFCNLHLRNYAPYMQEAAFLFRNISFNKFLAEGSEFPYQDPHKWGSNMQRMTNIRCLHLKADVFELIYKEYKRRRFVLNNLKKLSLSHVKCSNAIYPLVNFVYTGCPNLEEVYIHYRDASTRELNVRAQRSIGTMNDFCDCFFDNLKRVTLSGVVSEVKPMELVKFILRKATHLESLRLEPDNFSDDLLKVTKSCFKISPLATIKISPRKQCSSNAEPLW